MNEEVRIQELMDLFQILNPELKITSQYAVRGTTLEKLGRTGGPGYFRVLRWAQNKVAEKRREEPEESPEEQLAKLKEFFRECLRLFEERNRKYGTSWMVLTPEATANLIEMKANRARKLGSENAKALDEAFDMANYAGMLYMQLHEKK